jgi:hypothetical protein
MAFFILPQSSQSKSLQRKKPTKDQGIITRSLDGGMDDCKKSNTLKITPRACMRKTGFKSETQAFQGPKTIGQKVNARKHPSKLQKTNKTPWPLVSKRTILTQQPPLVGEI